MPLNKEQNEEVEQLRASSNTTLRATVPSLEEILYKPLSALDHGFVEKPAEKGACKIVDSDNVAELVNLLHIEAKVI